MRIPINRVVAFIGPYVSVAAGGVAAWLAARVNLAGVPGLDQHNLATEIAAGITFVVTSALVWLGHSKWLKGHHIVLQADLAASLAGKTPPSERPPISRVPDAG